MRQKVLFLCIENSCRSQIAEGIARFFYSEFIEVYSAGIQPGTINPLAIKVMEEIGIDISNQYSKSINKFVNTEFDYVITVCGSKKGECPVFPGKTGKFFAWKIEDPGKTNPPLAWQ